MEEETKHRPPKWADNFLVWFCSPEFIEEIQGDLHEAFHKRCQQNGVRHARFLFVVDTLRSISLGTTRKRTHSTQNSTAMFQNYFVIGFRNVLRSKVFSMINIFGLAIGMAACFLILQYVFFEWSYDKFHKDGNNIYRLTVERDYPTSKTLVSANHPGAGPALKADLPGVEEYARLLHQSIFLGDVATWSHVDKQGNKKVFNEGRVYAADPSFVTMFSYPFVYGNAGQALSNPDGVAISQSVSQKFFGNENSLGQTLTLNGRRNFIVTGVFKDIPENTHIKFDILISDFFSKRQFDLSQETTWKWAEFYTYIKLSPETDPRDLESKFDKLIMHYMGDYMKRMNFVEHFHLQPLWDIHLRSPQMTKEREVHGNERTVYFLLIIALLIIIIAWINFINLSTSKSIERAKEVGIRKAAGASKGQLIVQFLFESMVINAFAIVLAVILVVVALPHFNQLTGKNLGTSIFELPLLDMPFFWVAFAGAFVLGSLLAGLYPAFILSSFRAAAVLKGRFFGSQSGVNLRRVLVGSQFVISVVLIGGTIAVFRQVSYMRNADPGYTMDQLLVVKSPPVTDSITFVRMKTFPVEMTGKPGVNNITVSSEVPGRQIAQSHFTRNQHEGREEQFLYYQFFVDRNFLATYGLEIKAGRNFREGEHIPGWGEQIRTVAVIVNEKTIQLLKFKKAEDAVGKLIYFGLGARDWPAEIIGVVENHHQRSLKEDYDPIIYIPGADFFGQYFTLNVDMKDLPGTISRIQGEYEKSFPGNQFEYFFLDDHFNRQYSTDQRFGKVFGLFSALALIVAGLGLFGLSTFMIMQRTKEIAVRRVLGATITSMLALFSRDFVSLIFIANFVALPLVYFLVERWLESFAFRVAIGWTMFVIPAAILFLISLLTLSVQTIKTGLVNPVESLRSE
jgi:putative ABC transport system permease protein